MLEITNTTPCSITMTEPQWTRINRKNPCEKAILDYVVTDRETNNQICSVEIDSEGTYRLKNNNEIETDHETIIITTHVDQEVKVEKHKTWNIKNQEGWSKYNEIIKKKTQKNEIVTYEDLEKTIKSTLNKVFGKKTINKGTKPKESKNIREARQKKKQARKEFETALNTRENIQEKLEKYKETQITLRKIIENEQRDDIKTKYDRILKEGGTNSQYFWKIRRQIIGNNQPIEYDTITEEGKKIQEPQESKNYIAEYYENLYQARPATTDEI